MAHFSAEEILKLLKTVVRADESLAKSLKRHGEYHPGDENNFGVMMSKFGNFDSDNTAEIKKKYQDFFDWDESVSVKEYLDSVHEEYLEKL